MLYLGVTNIYSNTWYTEHGAPKKNLLGLSNANGENLWFWVLKFLGMSPMPVWRAIWWWEHFLETKNFDNHSLYKNELNTDFKEF